MKEDVRVLIADSQVLCTGEVLGCEDCNKVICDLVQHSKMAIYAPLMQGTPV